MSVTRIPAPALLAVLRGVIEAGRAEQFFGSQLKLQHTIAECRKMGLIDENNRATKDGQILYQRLSLSSMGSGKWIMWHIPYNQFVAPGERVCIPALAGRTGTVVGTKDCCTKSLQIGLDPLNPNRDGRTVTMMVSQVERLIPLSATA